ncbi:MAG: acetyl-CoA C-acetyltransferase [Polaromonas sp.]|jgi:acetyl-CoA C-acetyltransferase
MSTSAVLPAALIAGWARSAVAPHGGAFNALQAHEIAAPVIQALLKRASISPENVDAVVVGNALGAGGNPARLVALAAALPDACAAFSVDTQCCAGLDAVSMAVGLIASGQASVVIAGGVEAWSRAPIRHHRPLRESDAFVAYERPAFAPDPARDPDMLASAARYAAAQGWTRLEQDAYAVKSHERALARQAMLADEIVSEIVSVNGLTHDPYPRRISAAVAARMPAVAKYEETQFDGTDRLDCSLSALSISAKADGAGFVLLASPEACRALGLTPQATWIASASVGCPPETPLLAAEVAARAVLSRAGLASADTLAVIELHDAFAVQGLSFCQALHIDPQRVNRGGGGVARGHPIGASAAIALVRVLAELSLEKPSSFGLAAVAGAGGLGAAAIVQQL